MTLEIIGTAVDYFANTKDCDPDDFFGSIYILLSAQNDTCVAIISPTRLNSFNEIRLSSPVSSQSTGIKNYIKSDKAIVTDTLYDI